MSTLSVRFNPPLTGALASAALFKEDPFFLVDVGASGGINSLWMALMPHLKAVGFEPLLAEVDRLNDQSPSPAIRYEPAFVCYKNYQNELPENAKLRYNNPFARSSTLRALDLCKIDYVQSVYNQGEEVKFTDNFVELDEFFSDAEKDQINFLKIDTDGSDYQVLLGAKNLLSRPNLLGLSVEVQFQGEVHDKANLFCNIDLLLRSQGFSLYDLDVYKYSRADLPKPFVYNSPSNTTGGQVIWGEALYFRDFGDKNYEEMWSITPTTSQILKLACLYEMFGLEDCSAELLLKYKNKIQDVIDVEQSLNLLVPQVPGKVITFSDHQREFESYVRRVLIEKSDSPQEIHVTERSEPEQPAVPTTMDASSDTTVATADTEASLNQSTLAELETLQAEIQTAKQKLNRVQTKLKHTREQLHQTRADLDRSHGRIAAMESSKFWQLRQQWFNVKKRVGLKADE
jgi:FkbM family methyltransferase